MFIRGGQLTLVSSMETLGERFVELQVSPEHVAAAQALKPIDERQSFGKSVMLFDGMPQAQLSTLGETRHPSLADIFGAHMKGIYT